MKNYIIDEDTLLKIKTHLDTYYRICFDKKERRRVEDMLLQLNYTKEAPKECKCE